MTHSYASKHVFRALLGLGLSLGTVAASAQTVTPISFDGAAAYTQNFDGIGATGTAYPAGWDGVRLSGNGTTAVVLTATDGSANSGSTYNVGPTGDTDRALGSIASGSTAPAFGAVFTNASGAAITALSLSFRAEQWKSGQFSDNVEVLAFEYSLDATSLTTGTWTAVTALNVPEVANSITTAAALNGNDAANSANVNGTISGISWGAGSTMWIRWKDNNDNGTDALLAVDNFSLSRGTTTSTRNSLTAGNVRVFPNPAADNLTIQVAGRAAKTAVTVTDLMGRTVLKGTSALDGTFGLNALRAGQYILLVQDGNTLTSHKIVKQ